MANIIYPTPEKVIEYNLLVLTVIKAKKDFAAAILRTWVVMAYFLSFKSSM